MKLRELLSYLFLISIATFYTINGSFFYQEWMKGLIYISFLFGIGGIIMSFKSNIKSFFWVAIITIIIGGLFIKNADTRMLVALIGILSCYRLDKTKMLSVLFYTKLLSFSIVMFFGGYKHINGVAVAVGVLLLLFICTRERMELKQYVVVLLVYAFFTIYTKSGSLIVCGGVTILFLFLCRFTIGREICTSRVIWFIYPICMFSNYFFSIGVGKSEIPFVGKYMPHIFNNIYISLVNFFDEFTTHRLGLAQYSLGKFGVSLFGGNVDYSLLELGERGYFNLDSGYIWLLQGWGIIMTILFLVMSIFMMRYFCKTQKYQFIIAGIVIALWSINEDVLVGIGVNFLLLYFGNVIDYGIKGKK